jgi:hypothetical protein
MLPGYVKGKLFCGNSVNPTIHATRTRILKPLIDDIALEMFIWFPRKITTNRQTNNAQPEEANLIVDDVQQLVSCLYTISSGRTLQYTNIDLLDCYMLSIICSHHI